MTASRLSLYRGALRELGARSIASLTENRESRRILDEIWNGGAVEACLEEGFFNFSIRAKRIGYDPDYAPEYGYRYVFVQPDDYIRLYSICSDADFSDPITRYVDEAGYWYCDYDTIYVQYVSDDEDYGYNFSKWPETFVKLVELYMADEGCERITQSDSKKDKIEKALKKARINARSKDAMNSPVQFMHPGSWSTARRSKWGGFKATLPST